MEAVWQRNSPMPSERPTRCFTKIKTSRFRTKINALQKVFLCVYQIS